MKTKHSIKYEILAIVISLIVVIVTAGQVVGQQARFVTILTIIAASLGVGISAGRLIERIKKKETGEDRPPQR